MRRPLLLPALTALAAFAIVVPFTWAQSLPVPPGSPAAQADRISVVGEGLVTAQPNAARITFGVEVTNASHATALSDAAQRMDAALARARAAGIPDSDIRTTSFNVQPQYDQNGQLRGYQVQNLVDVKTTNIPGLGPLMDEVVAAGATRVAGIRFEAGDIEALKAQARELAMQNARAKADQFARLAGVSVGRPLVIQEADLGGVNPVEADTALAAPAAQGVRAPTPIQPGQTQVRTIVHVVWAIQ